MAKKIRPWAPLGALWASPGGPLGARLDFSSILRPKMGHKNHTFFQKNVKKHQEAEYLLNALPRTRFGPKKPQKSTKNQRKN